MRDNGINVIIGQRRGGLSWDKAVRDGWVPGKNLFELEEALEKASIIQYLLSDAGQIQAWPTVKKHLSQGKTLYFSHGFGITFNERSGIIPPADVDVILVPRVNTVEGLTQDHIQKWGWKVNEKNWVNFPDPQWRVYKNNGAIRWENKVHEKLVGYDTISNLPWAEEFSIYHPKQIERQERQNDYYNTL
jgi:hypothetical protein